jgi:hypothetical protein
MCGADAQTEKSKLETLFGKLSLENFGDLD